MCIPMKDTLFSMNGFEEFDCACNELTLSLI